MSDLKEFWEEQHKINDKYCLDKNVWNINYTIIETLKERQGLFFWERGGKEWAWMWDYDLNDCILQAEQSFRKEDIKAQDFLNCLACWGFAKLKEEKTKLFKDPKQQQLE
jgi:hypothetical protein